MAKLIILRGNSGSGKTSISKALQEKFGPNTMLLSHDMVRMEILHVWSTEGIIKSEPLMIHLLKYGKQHSEITIHPFLCKWIGYELNFVQGMPHSTAKRR